MSTSKIFVGGLSWGTKDEGFKEFFEKFGEVEEAIIMKDRNSNASRGFGFITFKEEAAMNAALQGSDLELDGRIVECKSAVPRETIEKQAHKTKKLFVGGLATETTNEEFNEYFANFGAIEEAIVMMDHVTGRARGFGFCTYENEESVDKVIEMQSSGTAHAIKGKAVECKRAVPREAMSNNRDDRGFRGGPPRGDFRGGPRGGGGFDGGYGGGPGGGYGGGYNGGYGGGYGGPGGRGGPYPGQANGGGGGGGYGGDFRGGYGGPPPQMGGYHGGYGNGFAYGGPPPPMGGARYGGYGGPGPYEGGMEYGGPPPHGFTNEKVPMTTGRGHHGAHPYKQQNM